MIEKVEAYIARKKRRISPKVLSLIFFFVFGIMLVISMDLLVRFKTEKDLVEDEYNRSMYEMISYVKNVNTQLNKLSVASSSKVIITTLADIWRQSNLAKENLCNLPAKQESMMNVSKFLAQLSDYSYYLIQKVSSGKKITIEEYGNLNDLSNYAEKLFNITSKIYTDLNDGKLKWDEVEHVANENLSDSSDINIYSISKTFQDYAGLIYDGAFSEHILNIKPKMLEGRIISEEDATLRLKSIYGENEVENIEYVGEQENNISLYYFKVKIKGEEDTKNIYITKDSGYIYLMISDRNVENRNITDKKAIDIGKEYLEKLGIVNVVDTYYITEENMITINYAAVQDDIILYPDLIKVKIALDTGEVCSLESLGYIYNHINRQIPENIISEEEILQNVNSNLEVKSVRKSIIPTDAKEEIFVYELHCSYDEKDYLIYINAETGEEEKILIMLETIKGVLTM